MKIIQQNNIREDIQILRAIAVLAVVFYHSSLSLVPEGYLGVDIFFVISGYLISLQLYKEMHAHSFSITQFYTRRIKRILPVFYVVVMLTVVVAQFIMVPSDTEKVGASAVWALMSAANVYFWLFQDNSYFAQSRVWYCNPKTNVPRCTSNGDRNQS